LSLSSQTCSLSSSYSYYVPRQRLRKLSPSELSHQDPNLHEMTYDVSSLARDDDDGCQETTTATSRTTRRTTLVYVEPDVATYYYYSDSRRQLPTKNLTKTIPKETSFSAKFINMSNEPVSFYWYVRALSYPARTQQALGAKRTALISSFILFRFFVARSDGIIASIITNTKGSL